MDPPFTATIIRCIHLRLSRRQRFRANRLIHQKSMILIIDVIQAFFFRQVSSFYAARAKIGSEFHGCVAVCS